MKKILLLFFIFFNLCAMALADVMPYYINSLRRYGIGYTQVQSPLVMRREAKGDGEILETLKFNFKKEETICEKNKDRCDINEVFAAYSKSKKLAFLTTLDYTEGWSLVCFNQTERPVCGWVQEVPNKYYTWGDFFGILGKKYGLYLFKDLQKVEKKLYGAPIKQSNPTGSIEMPKLITPWLVRGNWVLVKVNDFQNQLKTGWINFRGDDGKLKLFVKF
ncbi:hypothetical protein IJX73_00570 [bacterium]|nr:hypothetical protein [bacterium]MBQ9149403.1 hypothetical protein [bacterium]